MAFGDMLIHLRKSRKMTQKSLAKQLHVANTTLSAYERGTRTPSIEFVIDAAKFFGVSSDLLLGIQISASNCREDSFCQKQDGEDIMSILDTFTPARREAFNMLLKDMQTANQIDEEE